MGIGTAPGGAATAGGAAAGIATGAGTTDTMPGAGCGRSVDPSAFLMPSDEATNFG